MSLLLLLRNHQSGDTPEPETPTTSGGRRRRQAPVRATSARTNVITLTADLGRLTVHMNTNVEFADEDIIELL